MLVHLYMSCLYTVPVSDPVHTYMCMYRCNVHVTTVGCHLQVVRSGIEEELVCELPCSAEANVLSC